MSRYIIIDGVDLVLPSRVMEGGMLLIDRDSGKIKEVFSTRLITEEFLGMDVEVINGEGLIAMPGFIDIHVHGGGGYDFMDGTVEAFERIAEIHAEHGTTGMLPTTLTADEGDLLKTIEVYNSLHQRPLRGASFLGLHLEGPYFSMGQRGAQDPRFIRNPEPSEYKKILSWSAHIKRWSAAPELPGALEFASFLRANGVIVSMGHTDAVYEEALKGFESGFSLATHFYSMMSGVTRKKCFRYAGVVEACYLHDDIDVEIIADGVHLPAPLLKLIYKFKGPERIALITDSMRAAGMPPGKSILGSLKHGIEVLVEDGVAKMPDLSSFAGSVATADRLVRNMVQLAEIPLFDAVTMMSTTPARILNLQQSKGKLAKGFDADIVLMDQSMQVVRTIVEGRTVYAKSKNLSPIL